MQRQANTVADVFNQIALSQINNIQQKYNDNMRVSELRENKHIILMSDDNAVSAVRDYFSNDNVNNFLEEVIKYFHINFGKQIKDKDKLYNYAQDYFITFWKKRAKLYNSSGNLVYSNHEAVSVLKISLTIEYLRQMYVDYHREKYINKILDDSESAKIYDYNTEKIKESFNNIKLDKVISDFDKFISENSNFFTTKTYKLHRHSGTSFLINFYDTDKQKTIHVNVGTFLFLKCDNCNAQLQLKPKRERLADRKERLYFIKNEFLTKNENVMTVDEFIAEQKTAEPEL